MTPDALATDSPRAHALPMVSQAIALVVALLGVVVLVAWLADITVLKSVLPGAATMKANSALCFVLAGLSLWLLGKAPSQGLRCQVARAAASLVALVGLLTLGEYLFRWNPGLDEWLIQESLATVATPHPGRMALQTALSFTLLAAALLILDVRTRRGYWLAQYLVLPVLATAFVGLLGYLFGVIPFYGASFTGMAVHTAVGFLLCSLGVVAARPQRGIAALWASEGPGGLLVRHFLPVLVLAMAVTGWLILVGERRGLYDAEHGVAFFVVSSTVVVSGLTWWLAHFIRVIHAKQESVRAALQVSNAKLRELAALKDEFVSKVSHELRTPLTSVKEGLSLLMDNALGATTPDQQEFLRTMDGDIDRLTELITNMLDISKMEAGRMRLSRTRLDLRAVIGSTLRSCQPILGRRTVKMEGEPVSPVFADSGRMIQVFTNLLSNAIKFTPQDGSITFRLVQQDGMVSVAVQDNGPGIAPDDLAKLFQKFSQVGERPAGAPRGTGLGLVVCKELAELHGGRIDVASQVGAGTTFTVFLRAYSDAWALEQSVQEILAQLGPDEAPGVGLLLIEPDAPGPTRAGAGPAPAQLADDVRRHIHRGDTVLCLEPGRVAIVAATDARGCEAITTRLRAALPQGGSLRFAWAAHPADGADAAQLLARALERLPQVSKVAA